MLLPFCDEIYAHVSSDNDREINESIMKLNYKTACHVLLFVIWVEKIYIFTYLLMIGDMWA